MTRRLAELRRLPSRERTALLHAWVALLLVRSALRVLSLPRLLRLIPPASRASTASRLPAERLVALVDVAARRVPLGATCLERSLAASWLLARHGLVAALHIGVVRRNGGVAAHAWLEHEDLVFGRAGGDEEYEILAVLERGGA